MYLIDLFSVLGYVGLLGELRKGLQELLLIVHAVLGDLTLLRIALVAGKELVVLGLRLVVDFFLSFLLSVGVRDALVGGYVLACPDKLDCSRFVAVYLVQFLFVYLESESDLWSVVHLQLLGLIHLYAFALEEAEGLSEGFDGQ